MGRLIGDKFKEGIIYHMSEDGSFSTIAKKEMFGESYPLKKKYNVEGDLISISCKNLTDLEKELESGASIFNINCEEIQIIYKEDPSWVFKYDKKGEFIGHKLTDIKELKNYLGNIQNAN